MLHTMPKAWVVSYCGLKEKGGGDLSEQCHFVARKESDPKGMSSLDSMHSYVLGYTIYGNPEGMAAPQDWQSGTQLLVRQLCEGPIQRLAGCMPSVHSRQIVP